MITLLMLGDSLVEWGDWQRFLPGVTVVNRGLAGEMTSELAARLHDEMYFSAEEWDQMAAWCATAKRRGRLPPLSKCRTIIRHGCCCAN